jgi:stage II sporulation protein P
MMKLKKIKIRYNVFVFLIVLLIFISLFVPAVRAEDELLDGYYTVYEEKSDKKIFATSMVVNVGDEYLDEDNKLYEIVKVEGKEAYAHFKEDVDIQQSLEHSEASSAIQNFDEDAKSLDAAGSNKEKIVAIYHTHSDESYIPSDGKASIPYNGGIFKVGKALKASFEKKGIKVIHSNQPHDPHDSSAYQRSRRTVMELLKETPDVLIDVHRDGVPAEEYHGSVNNKELAKVRLVVGRQNPQMSSVKNFALQLKATADKKYSGLIKGIFYGKGGYNQDISPRSILIEAGTYENYRENAESGIDYMADVIATTLYGEDYEKKITPGGGTTTQVPGEGRGALRTVLWIIGISAVGIVAFALLSTGGIKELSSKVKKFIGSEFANFLGGGVKRSDSDKEKSDKENKGEETDDKNEGD